MQQDQAGPLKSNIPESPPLPEPIEAETTLSKRKVYIVHVQSQAFSAFRRNEIQSNETFNKHKKIGKCNEESETKSKWIINRERCKDLSKMIVFQNVQPTI